MATVPPATQTLKRWCKHPLTDKGLEAFLSDWAKTPARKSAECRNMNRQEPGARRRERSCAHGHAQEFGDFLCGARLPRRGGRAAPPNSWRAQVEGGHRVLRVPAATGRPGLDIDEPVR